MLLRTGAAGARRPAEETRRQLLGGEVEARDAALREVVEGVPEWGAAAAWIHQEDGDDLAGVAGEAAADANRLVLPRGGAAKDKPREQVRGGLRRRWRASSLSPPLGGGSIGTKNTTSEARLTTRRRRHRPVLHGEGRARWWSVRTMTLLRHQHPRAPS